jgi:hypothetical protein
MPCRGQRQVRRDNKTAGMSKPATTWWLTDSSDGSVQRGVELVRQPAGKYVSRRSALRVHQGLMVVKKMILSLMVT